MLFTYTFRRTTRDRGIADYREPLQEREWDPILCIELAHSIKI